MDEDLKEFDFGVNDIGIYLMESITTGLYKNPMNVLREYISNEMDNVPPPTEIEVKVDMKKLIITGNGPGMDFDGIRDAVKVGFSPKDIKKSIGFRGIGMYSGVSICDKIAVTSKRRENPKYYQIVIDCEGLREDIKESSSIPLVESLKKNVKWNEMVAPKERAKSHGTAVELIDILEDFKELLDEDRVRRYLEMTVPVEFDPSFPYKEKIYNYLKGKLKNDFRIAKLRVNNTPVYRAPKYISLDQPIFGKIQKGKHILGYYWICQNSQTGKIDDQYSRGFVYRKKGFTVGDRSTITNLFHNVRNKHLVDHVTGEIHIITDRLLPNTERVGFEASPECNLLEDIIVKDIGKEITAMTRKKSAVKKAEDRISKAKELPNKPKFKNKGEWLDEITKASNLLRDLERDLKSKYISGSTKKKVVRAHKRVGSWINKNSKPPEEKIPTKKVETRIHEEKKIVEEETSREILEGEIEKEDELPSKKILRVAEEKTSIEILEGEIEKEDELPSEWISSAVEDMCYRVGHSDWNDVIMKIIEVLRSDTILKTDEELRGFLHKLELRLAL